MTLIRKTLYFQKNIPVVFWRTFHFWGTNNLKPKVNREKGTLIFLSLFLRKKFIIFLYFSWRKLYSESYIYVFWLIFSFNSESYNFMKIFRKIGAFRKITHTLWSAVRNTLENLEPENRPQLSFRRIKTVFRKNAKEENAP